MSRATSARSQSALTSERPPIVWSVAGSDSGAGAGLQADVRAFEAMEVHGCTVVAAITAQNSLSVQLISPVLATVLDAQLAALAEDMPPAAIKVGMIGSVDNLRVLVQWIDRLRLQNPHLVAVVDPVLSATTGVAFAQADLIQAYREELLPRADVITPNRAEAAMLLQQPPLIDALAVEDAAQSLVVLGCKAVIITGGDAQGARSEDYVISPHAQGWLSLPRVNTANHHGTGCVFAASVAAAMARGFVSMEALILAKMATAHALRQGYQAGQGAGPVRPRFDFAQHIDNLPGFSLPSLSGLSHVVSPLAFAALSEPSMGLYAVVDSADWVQRVLDAGVRTVQLRIKHVAHDEATDGRLDATKEQDHIRQEVRRSIAYARMASAQLFVNDHWKIAIEEGAYGIHLGQEDLQSADLNAIAQAGLRLGISTHCYWEVCRAWQLQPSYIACGPIHPTRAKDMPWRAQTNRNLAYWSALLPLPVVAIGGMTGERAQQAMQCGASGVAFISAICSAESPELAIEALQQATLLDPRQERAAMPLLAQATLSY